MRLIDVDALGVGRCSRDLLPADYCAGWNGLIRLLAKAPTVDAAPVVRCKDCRYFKMYKCRMGYSSHDDFCSYGERRGGGEDG